MKKRYIIPAFDIVFISHTADVMIVDENYTVGSFGHDPNGTDDYTIGGEEDDSPANQVSFSLWDEE